MSEKNQLAYSSPSEAGSLGLERPNYTATSRITNGFPHKMPALYGVYLLVIDNSNIVCYNFNN